MALRSSGRRYGWEGVVGENVGVIGLKGGYHGDTVCLGVFPKSAILR
jgi:dethiobiotin synthetase/adenosylmethionine--8-amino-7-oxononanoate aminotransferase